MEYVECPLSPLTNQVKLQLFLAGGITNCLDWQHTVVERLCDIPIRVFNPRRTNFDTSNPLESDIQIRWEFTNLNISDVIIFYFPKESICPIALYELGRFNYIETLPDGPRLFICCDKDYPRINDVLIQTKLANGCKVYTDFEQMLNDVFSFCSFYHPRFTQSPLA